MKNGRRQADPVTRVCCLDAEEHETGGQPIENPAKLDCLRDAETMATDGRGRGNDIPLAARALEAVQGTRYSGSARVHGIDEHNGVAAVPPLHEGNRLATLLDEADIGQAQVPQSFDRGDPDTVVVPVRVADTDNERTPHEERRSTRRSRKWVAHEMHGS